MLQRLELIYNQKMNLNENFFEVPDVVQLKKLLNKAAFFEFNDFWKNHYEGRYTYKLFLTSDGTSKRLHDVSFNRTGERLYYTFSFRQNLLNYFWYAVAKKGDTDRCRFCNIGCENVEHILGGCDDLDDNLLRVACDKNKLIFIV